MTGEERTVGVNSRGPLLVPGRWLSWWDGLGDGLHMALATLAPLTVHAVHPANTRQLQTSQLPDHLHSSGFRIVTALSSHNFYLCICSERGGTINMALVHMISLR